MSYIGQEPAYGVFNRQTITGDGSTAVFDLDFPVAQPTSILVSLDGVVQEPEYSYTTNIQSGTGKITFTSAPSSAVRIFIIYMGRQLLTAQGTASSPHLDTFNGDGSTTAFTLTRLPSAANGANLITFVNGVYQRYGASYSYTVSGTAVTFSEAPTAGTNNIQVLQLAESNNSIQTVADGTITNAKLSLSYSTTTYTGDGSTASFTINSGHTAHSILVFYNGICMKPTSDYSVTSTSLNFTFTPLLSSDIVIRYLPV